MSTRIVLQIHWAFDILTSLQSFKILPHVLAVPGRVSDQLSNPIPVTVMRIHRDHGIMRRASAQRAGPGVQDPLPLRPVFTIPRLACFILIVPDKEIPTKGWVLARQAMEGGDGVMVILGVASSLQQKHLIACFRQVHREGASAGSGPNYHIIEFRFSICRHCCARKVTLRTWSAREETASCQGKAHPSEHGKFQEGPSSAHWPVLFLSRKRYC